MFSTDLAVALFIINAVAIFLIEIIKKFSQPLLNIICYFFLISGILLFIYGISLIVEWNPIPANADTSAFYKRRGGGFALLIIKIWPYFLLFIGFICTFLYIGVLRERKKLV